MVQKSDNQSRMGLLEPQKVIFSRSQSFHSCLRDPVRQQQQESPNRQWDHQSDCRKQRVNFYDSILRKQSPNQRGEQGDVNREIYPNDRHQLKVRKHSTVQGEEGDHRHDKESARCV